ncbi:hypothetical protein [Streptomyces qinglanensis]|uniref:Uncharacterized protein n=1 Tax=Streptomyces qinglanensis TaxID=943816 RepID=A0A1H9W070_9ACTN|nr:hypothetical protein [Streptomyces qinglanensis]SES27204.1 hypothetical protein SAMN05421870_11492 [Streptomyces qinglanensis]
MTTHNGRGQDGTSGSPGDALPASTTPYEGVVLPSNGDPWTPQQQRQVQSERDHVQPPAGQPWGQPWGPGSDAAQGGTPETGAAPGTQNSPGYWGAPQQGDRPGALPPEGAPARPPHPPSMPPESAGPLPGAPGPGGAQGAGGPGAMPPEGAPGYDRPGPDAYGQAPSVGTGYPQPGAGAADPYGAPAQGGAHALPQQPPAYPPSTGPADGSGRHAAPAPSTAPPGPPLPGAADGDATQMLPPFPADLPSPGGASPGGTAAPGGAVGPDDGTQLLPPQPAGPVGGGPDSEATQYMAPVAGADSEATQMLPPMSADAGPPGAGGQSPGEPEARKPLPEFENLFRSDSPRSGGPGQPSGGRDEPGSTQSMPVFDQAAGPPGQGGGYGYPQPGSQGGGYGYPQSGSQGGGYGYPQPGSQQYEPQPGGRAARRDADRGRRRTPPWLLIGGGLAGVAVVGLVVGLLLADGGDSSGGDKPKASTAPAGEESSAPADPVEAQAKKLDALLADSNNSRSQVIRSVQNIKNCTELDKAASDLRSAAKQRTGLVRRLGELETDKLPDSAELNSALKSAWRSSASADNHYAAWADQAAGKKGCHKGKAKTTRQLAAANRASGSATTAKKKAAGLWNPTAKKYGLKERPFGSL